MLQFFRKIIKKDEQQSKAAIEISLNELDLWIEGKSKPYMEEVMQQASQVLMKVDEEVQRTRISMDLLEFADLQNPNIPFKAKQYMEGNRKAYIKSINSFLGQMEINNKDYFYLLDFCKSFEYLMNDLNKSTFRSYAILQEFFANETAKIAKNLKNFDEMFKDLKSILNSPEIKNINKARTKTQNLKAKSKQKINFSVDLKSAEAELSLANQEKLELLAQIESFNKSEDHNFFLSLTDQKKSMMSTFQNEQDKFLQSFSILERPLRKYSHTSFENEEIILKYLGNPIESLTNDREFKILGILEKLKEGIASNSIQLDDKKKEKSIEEIKKLNKKFLERLLKDYYSFKEQMEEVEKKMKATNVAEKFRQFNKRLEDLNIKIEKLSEESKKLGSDFEKISKSINEEKEEIKSDAKGIFKEDLVITG